ncbi:MAG: hypothetical protein VKL59_11705 [Nostocaceae cyanobacterium]|nr:hypothetical protein [Nostocaceae cyanobacterium]
MTDRVIDSQGKGCLILILPISLLTIFFFATWRILLVVILLGAMLNIWQRYQWQKWCQQINPVFHQLIQENQGKITPMDLAMRANLPGEKAQRYLETKAEEFGAREIEYEDAGKAYYFITASILGSLFDASEPPKQLPGTQVAVSLLPETEQPPVPQQFTESLLDAETSEEQAEQPEEPPAEPGKLPLQKQLVFGSLIQSELAKRLNVYSSTVYKRRDDPEFPEWSRSRDPDGIAWTYSPDTKEFFPLEE